MTTVNQRRVKSHRIQDHLRKRPRRDVVLAQVRQMRNQLAERRAAYHGGTTAEQDAYRMLSVEARRGVRALILGRTGRRIDLVSLLRQRRPDGNPVWAIADPTKSLHFTNGGRNSDGDATIAWVHIIVNGRAKSIRPSGGFPPLPPQARALVTDPKIRRRAEWVGVLYQPEEWREVDPDPAVIVKWRGVDGYYCLAVWGGDAAGIMEFVD